MQEAALLPESLGFRNGASSVHTSRTMMLDELVRLLAHVPADAKADAYLSAIVEDNELGKSTRATRERTAQRLAQLYSLDPGMPVFRVFRSFWQSAGTGRPLLAFLVAAARDPLLRETSPYLSSVPFQQEFNAADLAAYVAEKYPARFRSTTLKSTSQNLASSFTQAGYLVGKVKKSRSRPAVTPPVAAFAALLGYLVGLRGKLLLDSLWTRLLDRPLADVVELIAEASRQGWLTYKAAGSVVEISFSGLLRPHEERIANEQN